MPLVIVNVDPEFEHAPELENVTTPPGADAATEKLEPKIAAAGACVDTVIVWFAFGVTAFESSRLRARTEAVRCRDAEGVRRSVRQSRYRRLRHNADALRGLRDAADEVVTS